MDDVSYAPERQINKMSLSDAGLETKNSFLNCCVLMQLGAMCAIWVRKTFALWAYCTSVWQCWQPLLLSRRSKWILNLGMMERWVDITNYIVIYCNAVQLYCPWLWSPGRDLKLARSEHDTGVHIISMTETARASDWHTLAFSNYHHCPESLIRIQ
jgi:hypothetical protein